MEEHLKHTPPPKGGRRRERGKERESRWAAGREGSASMGFTLTDGAAAFPRAKGERGRGRVKRRRRWKTRQKGNAQQCVYPQR